MKVTVYLYRSPECTRGWLAYLTQGGSKPTLEVVVEAETRAKAKNIAVTIVNRDFGSLIVTMVNRDEKSIYSVTHFPEIEQLLIPTEHE